MTSLERELDELYALSPADFTARRDALVKAHKKDGDPQTAAALSARRRPTQTAWILNQLTRRHADDIAAFVDAGRALARIQRKALRGEDASELRSALAEQRKRLSTLQDRAAAVVDDLGLAADEHAGDVSRALQAALLDPTAAVALEEGRLERAPEVNTGAWSDDPAAGALDHSLDVGPAPQKRAKTNAKPSTAKPEKSKPQTSKPEKSKPKLVAEADADSDVVAPATETARRRPQVPAQQRQAVHKAAAKQRVREARRVARDAENAERAAKLEEAERTRAAKLEEAAVRAREQASAAERRAREQAIAIIEAAEAEARVLEQQARDATRVAEEQQAAATSLASRLDELRTELKRVEREADELRFAASQAATTAKKTATAAVLARGRADRLARRAVHDERR